MPETINRLLLLTVEHIAAGTWNVGRDPAEALTANEYARLALEATGFAPAVETREDES